MNQSNLRNPSVVIIGAGMTGILMTIKLREAGVTDITILEKKEKVGGTWRENTYPGLSCDIPSHMYTYSFEPNPEWSNRYAYGPEIQEYFERVGRKYGVTNTVRFNEAVTSCVYESGKWTVETSKGDTLKVDFVISATGILHHPAKPDIPGLDTFKGAMFHTAEWDHSVPLEGKRIGIIGTGSTAAQTIPELVKVGGKVSVFQRTPQWIINLPNKSFSGFSKRLWKKMPWIMGWIRAAYTFGVEQSFSKAVIGKKIPHLLVSAAVKLNLRFSIKNDELREKLRPDYRVGCKRLIINSTFYKAIQQPNADLVTDGIERIEPDGVVTKDGKKHELDVLVLSTGFHPFNFMRPMNMQGKQGVDIDDAWDKKIQAYRSLLIPGFPNFFLMLGPNTPIGNFSVIAMSEVQSKYVLKLIHRWRQGQFDAVDAKPSAMKQFYEYIKAGMGKTVWLGGCQSWYLDADGDPAMWPYSWKQWVKEMDEPIMADLDAERFSEVAQDHSAEAEKEAQNDSEKAA